MNLNEGLNVSLQYGEREGASRKIIEGCYIGGNREKCMNLNEGLNVSPQYGEREGHGYGGEGRKTRREGCHRKPSLSNSLRMSELVGQKITGKSFYL